MLGYLFLCGAVRCSTLTSLIATDAAGCATTVSKVTFVTTKPQPRISGELSFCPDASTTLSAGSGFASYAWSNGSTANSVSINSVGKYHITATDTFRCTGADTAFIGQFVPPTP